MDERHSSTRSGPTEHIDSVLSLVRVIHQALARRVMALFYFIVSFLVRISFKKSRNIRDAHQVRKYRTQDIGNNYRSVQKIENSQVLYIDVRCSARYQHSVTSQCMSCTTSSSHGFI